MIEMQGGTAKATFPRQFTIDPLAAGGANHGSVSPRGCLVLMMELWCSYAKVAFLAASKTW